MPGAIGVAPDFALTIADPNEAAAMAQDGDASDEAERNAIPNYFGMILSHYANALAFAVVVSALAFVVFYRLSDVGFTIPILIRLLLADLSVGLGWGSMYLTLKADAMHPKPPGTVRLTHQGRDRAS
jgi:hypothetical protein